MIDPTFSYIQLHRHGKIPTKEWRGDPRALLTNVKEWVAQGFNLGVRTDRQTGAWVLDVDVDVHTLEHSAAWQALLDEHGLPATMTVKSPSGGLHYYFRFPEGIDVRNDQGRVIADGVDIRGIGGYVVAPGMYASYNKHGVDFEGTYEIIDDSPIAQTPEWLVERFHARDEKDRERAERANTGQPVAKAEVIGADTDLAARKELNDLFALVDQLARLPEGETLEIFGEERGWERGSGFYVLACKIVEVARWPHTNITVEDAQKAWVSRVPGKYAQHDWSNAVSDAGHTWEYGDRHFVTGGDDLFTGVRRLGGSPETEPASVPTDVSDKPIGWGIFEVFIDAEGNPGSGSLQVEEARRRVTAQGKIAIDNSGSLWAYKDGVYLNDDKVVLNRLYHMLGDRFTTTHLSNVKHAIQATAPLLDLTVAPNPGVMNFTNGLLEWRTGEIIEHRDDTLETTQFPYDWDPTAGCPNFDRWLETMLEPEQVQLAWKVLGYMMLSGNPLQVAFMLYGKGSNGKSTFAHVIEHLIGMGNTSAVPLKDFNARFATSAMIGKVANIVGDIDAEYQVSTAALKQITGADALQFERKNRDAFRATLWATCLFSANKIPGTNDGSEGYAERWVPIHFKRKAADHRIEGFSEERLWEEIQGIAAKAVAALRTIPLHQGADRSAAFDLTSDSAQEAVEEFREASNSFYAWVKNHTAPSESDIMTPRDLWAAYRTDTGSRMGGLNCPPAFAEVLSQRYGQSKMRRGMRHGVQQNLRSYAVTLVEENELGTLEENFFSDVQKTS